jgi:hypothetical protein
MSFQQSSSSFSYSTSSSNGATTGQAYKQESVTDSRGTTVRTTSQQLGQPSVEETRHYDHSGRELQGDPTGPGSTQRITDVTDETDADRRYQEAMDDEYAKREGGA